MKRMMRLALISLVSTFAISTASFAEDFTKGAITVSSAWSRATADAAKVGGGFFQIKNKSDKADKLLGITSDVSEKVEIHEMTMDGNVMKMREIGALEVPANTDITLKPGGLHIMFIGLKAPLKEGDVIPATMHFENTDDLEVKFIVESMATKAPKANDADKAETSDDVKHHMN